MRKTVAIVSSTLALSELLADLVRQAGPRAEVLPSSRALKSFMQSHSVDLVVVDTELGEGDALGLVRYLRAREELSASQFAILALTRAAPEFHGSLLAAGVDEVLPKPVIASHFLGRIRNLCQPAPRRDNVVSLFAARRERKSA